jgi:hypothetical protein
MYTFHKETKSMLIAQFYVPQLWWKACYSLYLWCRVQTDIPYTEVWEDKVKLSDVWRSGCIVPHFLDLDSSWRWVVSFTTQPLYPRGESPRYPLDRRLGGPQNRSGRRREEKILVLTETRTPTSTVVQPERYPGSWMPNVSILFYARVKYYDRGTIEAQETVGYHVRTIFRKITRLSKREGNIWETVRNARTISMRNTGDDYDRIIYEETTFPTKVNSQLPNH